MLEIARALSTEREIDKLLALILEKARYICGADAGSLYVVEGEDPVLARRQLRLPVASDFERSVVPFDERSTELVETLAAQAGIALENALLYREISNIFEGFVKASVDAIEARDPTTSGHARRVADLTVS